jgi:lysozyme
MAKIREYQSQVNPQGQASPGRRAEGTDFGGGQGLARLGASLTGVGSDLGLIAYRKQQADEAREVTDVYVQFAKKESEWSQRLREESMTADPSNLAYAEEFNDRVLKDIDSLDGKYSTAAGRDAYMKHKASMGAHFVERAGAFQAQMTGAYARQSAEGVLDQRRNAVYADPNQFPRASQDMVDFLNDPSGYNKWIPQADRQKMSRTAVNQLALSAVQGTIKNGMPETAKHELESGKWDPFIDADKKAALINEAQVTINGRNSENDRLRLVREREKKKEDEATGTKFLAKALKGELTNTEITSSNLPPTGELSQEHYIELNMKLAKELAEKSFKTLPSVYQDLFERIHAKQGDPRRLTSEAAIDKALGHGLDPTAHEKLRKEYRENRDDQGNKFSTQKKAFFDGMKPQIDKSNPLMGKLDQSGAAENYRFMQYVDTQIDEYREAGKDPRVLLDPTKPEFLGRPEIIAGFQKSILESGAAFTRQNTPKAPPPPEEARKPKESFMDWLKREGGALFERTGNVEGSVPPAQAPAAPALPKAEDTPKEEPDQVMEMLKQDEGFRGQVYKDTKGKTTIAYGRNLDAKPLKKEEGEYLLKGDISDARREAATTFPYYNALTPARKDAMTMLTFNLGPTGLKGFKRFNEAMKDKNYVTAAAELLDSEWAATVGPTRSNKIANMIRTGKTE